MMCLPTGLTKKRSKRRSPLNPFIKAAMAEARQLGTYAEVDCNVDAGDYSDLEDFIVCKPDRSYELLFANHYRYAAHA